MAQTLASLYDAALLDLDGTIYEGARPIPHAQEALQAAGLPMVFITNNASRAPKVVADQLRSLGYECVPDDVLTSAQAAIEMAAEEIAPGSPVYVLGAESFKELAREAGYTVVDSADDAPAAVLHGLNREMTWAQISEAALSISRGAKYLVSNLDTTLPDERGFLVGNGSVAAAITTTTGVAPRSAGKPLPPMFHSAAKKVGAKAPLGIGDRLDTDIAGGVAAGIDTYMVLTGVSTHLDVVNAPQAHRPTLIGADMRGLNLPKEFAEVKAQAGFVARRDAQDPSVVIVSGGTEGEERLADAPQAGVAALLTVAALVWPEADAVENSAVDADSEATGAAASTVSEVRAEGVLAEFALQAWK